MRVLQIQYHCVEPLLSLFNFQLSKFQLSKLNIFAFALQSNMSTPIQ